MKLYNKKGFFHGLGFWICGVLDVILIAVGYFTVLWFWLLDSAVLFCMGGFLVFRALSQEKSQRDLTGNWKLGGVVIYNKYGFFDGLFILQCAVDSMFIAWSKGLGWQQHVYTAIALYFGLKRIVRAVTLEDAKQDLVEERDERNRMVILKAQAMSFQIIQAVSLLLMFFLCLKGGRYAQLDFVSAGFGAALCFLATILADIFTRKYYEKHL